MWHEHGKQHSEPFTADFRRVLEWVLGLLCCPLFLNLVSSFRWKLKLAQTSVHTGLDAGANTELEIVDLKVKD